jgi:hypothetical protein
MTEEEIEKFKKDRTCEKCQYSEPSFNLLYCLIHQRSTTSQETCYSFEKKYDPDWFAEMALQIWRP